MNSTHNPLFTYEQALHHNEQLAQVLLSNIATSLEGLESNYFKAKRLDDTLAKVSTNNYRNILESNCAYLNQFYSDGVLSAETSQHVQNAVSTIEMVLSVYPSFPQSETIPAMASSTAPKETQTRSPQHGHPSPSDSGKVRRNLRAKSKTSCRVMVGTPKANEARREQIRRLESKRIEWRKKAESEKHEFESQFKAHYLTEDRETCSNEESPEEIIDNPEPSTPLTFEPLAPLLSLPQEGNDLLSLNKDDHELKTDLVDAADALLTSNEPEIHSADSSIESSQLPLTLEPPFIDSDQILLSPLDVRNPPLDVGNPPLDVGNPPLDVRNTPFGVENPPLDVKNPPLDVENSPPSFVGGTD